MNDGCEEWIMRSPKKMAAMMAQYGAGAGFTIAGTSATAAGVGLGGVIAAGLAGAVVGAAVVGAGVAVAVVGLNAVTDAVADIVSPEH